MDDLVPCPLCGGEKGYTLREGSTYRLWGVSCAACGDELGECHADRTHGDGPLPTRWEHADDHWNAIGAHAQSLRAQLAERDRDAERWRYVDENAAWHRRDDEDGRYASLVVKLPYESDLSCKAMRAVAIDAAMGPSSAKAEEPHNAKA